MLRAWLPMAIGLMVLTSGAATPTQAGSPFDGCVIPAFSIDVGGQPANPTAADANGGAPAMDCAGVTYLPVPWISRVLGIGTSWDGASQTLAFGASAAPAAASSAPALPAPASPAAPSFSDWLRIAQASAPFVTKVDTACGSLCGQPGYTGTGYRVIANFGAGPQATLVTAYHVVCDSGFAATDMVAFGASWTPPTGAASFCSAAGLYTSADIAEWPNGVGGLSLSPIAPMTGDQVIVLGHPNGDSPVAPVLQFGVVGQLDQTVSETNDAGALARVVPGAFEILMDAAEGISGAPVLNARGQVVGTVIAGGAATVVNGVTMLHAYAVPLPGQYAWPVQ